MSKQLINKVALVTGATRGVGKKKKFDYFPL
jgi:hypothetical protein